MNTEMKVIKWPAGFTVDEVEKMAREMLEALEREALLPAYYKPLWGHWDRNFDFRTSISTAAEDHSWPLREWSSERFVVRLICDAAGTCPSGPCGVQWELVGYARPGTISQSEWHELYHMQEDARKREARVVLTQSTTRIEV